MGTRHTFVATGLVTLIALAGVTAAIAADPAGDPPPKIAFLANGIVPADALAAGPIAGQLGAPVFTTPADTLSAEAAEGLDDHAPELVIVLGGPVAIHDGVLAQVSAVTGLPIKDPDSRPDTGIVRAAGENRFATAQVVAGLLGHYDPAWLGVDLKAADADLLDGKDSSEFLGKSEKAADSNLLDGRSSTAFQPAILWAAVDADGTIVEQSGGIDMTYSSGTGGFYLDLGQDVSGKALQATLRYTNDGEFNSDGQITTGVCATDKVGCLVPGGMLWTNHVVVLTNDPDGVPDARPFYLVVFP